MTARAKTFLLLAAVVLSVSVAHAHDCWLFPERFILEPGDRLVVRQRFGHDLHIDVELPLDKDETDRFELVTSSGAIDLLEEAPERIHPRLSPLLARSVDFEGAALLVMDHDFDHIEMSSRAFSAHLQHEELTDIQELRAKSEPRIVERERYMRCMKSLIQVGEEAAGELYKKVVGQRLEIVLLQNPYTLAPDDHLDVRIVFDGEPLAGKAVWAQNGSDGHLDVEAKAITDPSGIARFQLTAPGFWLVRLVYTLPCNDCPDDDWQSFWASFSFELQP